VAESPTSAPLLELAAARVFADASIGPVRLDHPEGVAVAADGSVWCGGEAGQVYRIAPDGASIDVRVGPGGGFTLALAFAPDGSLYYVDLGLRAVMRLDPDGGEPQTVVAGSIGGRELRLPNAIAFDAEGNLYLTESWSPTEQGPGVYRIDRGGRAELWSAGPFLFANGVAVAPDASAVFVAETWSRRVSRVAVNADGSAGEPEAYVELPGTLPDGLAFGPEGMLYVACYQPSQIVRIDTDGHASVLVRDDDAIVLAHPTNIAFRGQTAFCANLGRWHITAVDLTGLGPAAAPERA
jgi:sugar lactone lactonase YvrE